MIAVAVIGLKSGATMWMRSSYWQGLAAAVQAAKQHGLILVLPNEKVPWAEAAVPTQHVLDAYYSRASLLNYTDHAGIRVVEEMPHQLGQECVRQLHAWREQQTGSKPHDVEFQEAQVAGVMCMLDASPMALGALLGQAVDVAASHGLMPYLQLNEEWGALVDKFCDAVKQQHDTRRWLAVATSYDDSWRHKCSARDCRGPQGNLTTAHEGCHKEFQDWRCWISDEETAHALYHRFLIPSHSHVLMINGPADDLAEAPITCSYNECLSLEGVLGAATALPGVESTAITPDSSEGGAGSMGDGADADSAAQSQQQRHAAARAFAHFHAALRALRVYGNMYSQQSRDLLAAMTALGRGDSFFWLNPEGRPAAWTPGRMTLEHQR